MEKNWSNKIKKQNVIEGTLKQLMRQHSTKFRIWLHIKIDVGVQ